jgi:exodeoxyribonuclease V gamma subunit
VEALLPKTLPLHYRVAAELLKARLGEAPRRHRAPEGVTVASFVPMRALPFRHIFVVGLDERVFPATGGVRALDLRAASRHPGDVTPREQDEHMFLETLLAARERITLSYVARDPVTGEDKNPSSVVRALLDLIGSERTADAPPDLLRARPPLARHEDAAASAVISSAARERRAATLGASLRQAGGGASQLPALGELRQKLVPNVWSVVASELDWVAPPAPTTTRARRGLTLADLRRFLECPLQASARVLLPVGDDDDAAAEAEAALREHEPLDEARARTVPFLRDLAAPLLGAAEAPGDAAIAAAYDRQAESERLAGVLPDGLFGRALRERHLALLRCWRDGVQQIPDGVRTPPATIWLGAGPEHQRNLSIVPPVPLVLADGTTIALGGRTSLCAEGGDGARVVLSLVGSTTRDYVERDLLSAFFTHLALAAMGGAHAERTTHAVIVRPKDTDGTPRLDERRFGPVDAETARAYLAGLASELLGAPHAYFLPCEGVFTWKRRVDDGKEMAVRDAVLLLRDDNWTRFVSDRGPIPDPREYPVPPENEVSAIVERRFRAYLTAIAPDEAAPKRSKKR